MTRYYRREIGLGLPESKIIGVTGSHNGVTVNDLCKSAFLDRTHGSRLLKGLEDRGFLERRVNPQDSRSSLIFLTHRGREVLEDITQVTTRIDNELFGALEKKDRRIFDDFVQAITSRILALQQEDGTANNPVDQGSAKPRKNSD